MTLKRQFCGVSTMTMYIIEYIFWYLFIQELPRVLLDVSLVQVCGETHETHFRQTEISEFNVTH